MDIQQYLLNQLQGNDHDEFEKVLTNVINENMSVTDSILLVSVFLINKPEKYVDTIREIIQKMPEDDPSVQLLLARLHREGLLFPKNIKKAISYYKQATLKNNWARLEFQIIINSGINDISFNLKPSDIEIECRTKKKLAISNIKESDIDLIVTRFPLFHYDLVGCLELPKSNADCNSALSLLRCTEPYDVVLCVEDDLESNYAKDNVITISRYKDDEIINTETIKCCFGEKNPDKIIYVLVPSTGQGILSIREVFSKLNKAYKNKGLVFADLQNFPSTCISFEELGQYNPWEYLFEQFSSIQICDIYSSKNVIFWRINNRNFQPGVISINNRVEANFSSRLLKKTSKHSEEMKMDETTVIGVQARGTDYLSIRPTGHLIPFDEYELCRIIDIKIKEVNCNCIYISTEDKDIFEYFKYRYGEKLKCIDQERFSKKDGALNVEYELNYSNAFEKIKIAENYLIATLLFSKCNLIYATAGTAISLIREISDCPIIYCRKSKWGDFGSTPICIDSIGKNALETIDCKTEKYSISGGTIAVKIAEEPVKIEKNRFIFHKEYKYKKYFFSVHGPDCDSVSYMLTEYNNEGMVTQKKIRNSLQLEPSTEAIDVTISNNTGSTLNCTIGVQIEYDGPSEYESYHNSVTIIPILDNNGREIITSAKTKVDFENNIVINGEEVRHLHADTISLFNNVVLFPKGTEHAQSSTGSSIIGMPKSLLLLPISYHEGIYHEKRGQHDYAKSIIRTCAYCGDIYAEKHYISLYKNELVSESKGIEISKHVFFANNSWKSDALSALDMIGTQSALVAMAEICLDEAIAGNPDCMGRLGRMYRDGKGVEKNIDNAILWFEKASVSNKGWSPEYIDSLLMKQDPEYFKIAFEVCQCGAENGQIACMGRLGRMYRDGKGVEKNINNAILWFEKASRLHEYYEKELNQLMSLEKNRQ